ncbi:exodeoxyribonuclease VII large subunit [Candidatus Saccharibacteria bacterium]|nr:exodeoxyribonuclease VII large subunit [Candidatus Saccharibacteria bacterium]
MNDDLAWLDELYNPPEPNSSQLVPFTVSQLLDSLNRTLKGTFPRVTIEGEVISFKVNQGKWVFFDLKDEESSVNCFMPLWDLHIPLEDGMKVILEAEPKLTKWGKFSLTVKKIQPRGQGNIKKAFDLLKEKLEKEGLFDQAKKRPIPTPLTTIGVISSTDAAGYADFIKIINARWGGLKIKVYHTQVQGLDAPAQIVQALDYFNQKNDVDIIAIMRGGGSVDDLAAFNDEVLTRKIAASKIPVITGIGHEVDISLADLAADIRASTPSNVAELLTPDRAAQIREIDNLTDNIYREIITRIDNLASQVDHQKHLLELLNPDKVLKRGYAIISGKIAVGNIVKITTHTQNIKAEIKEVKNAK